MNECSIVEDLLPLYIEDLTQTETGEFVNAHLESCRHCAAVYRRMTAPVQTREEQGDYRKSIRKGLLNWTGRVLLVLVLVIGLPLYFIWETGALGTRTVLASENGENEFVIVDNSNGGLFNRGGAYVVMPDGKSRNLKGDPHFEKLEVNWAPNGESYFARWVFDTYSESYFRGDEGALEPEGEENTGGAYEEREWPRTWDFLEQMTAFVRGQPGLFGHDLGEFEYTFDMWSLDSQRMYFVFTTDNGYGGRVRFDCVTKEFTLQKIYQSREREVRIPVEVPEERIKAAGEDEE